MRYNIDINSLARSGSCTPEMVTRKLINNKVHLIVSFFCFMT